MVFVGILHIGDNGVFELCAFSQDPERLPRARGSFWYHDRVFCVSPANAIFWTERFV